MITVTPYLATAADKVDTIAIPAELNVIATYPIAVVTACRCRPP